MNNYYRSFGPAVESDLRTTPLRCGKRSIIQAVPADLWIKILTFLKNFHKMLHYNTHFGVN